MGNLTDLSMDGVSLPDSYDVLPKGQYRVQIEDTEVRISQAGAQYLSVKLRVCDGPYEGRLLWDNLSLWHPSEKVSQIAKSKLEGYRHACGIQQKLEDTSELHSRVLDVLVQVKQRDGDEPRNEIRRCAAASGALPISDVPPWHQPT